MSTKIVQKREHNRPKLIGQLENSLRDVNVTTEIYMCTKAFRRKFESKDLILIRKFSSNENVIY